MKYILLFLLVFYTGKNPVQTAEVNKSQEVILLNFYNNSNTHLQQYLVKEVSGFYNCKVETNIAEGIPKEAYYAPRNRYKADTIIKYLKVKYNRRYGRVVGLTDKDISTTKGNIADYGIFGLGYCPGASCVVSSFRLKGSSMKLLTVTLHEIGHTYGLPHCPDSECLMADAKGKMIKTHDKPYMCSLCKNKIKG